MEKVQTVRSRPALFAIPALLALILLSCSGLPGDDSNDGWNRPAVVVTVSDLTVTQDSVPVGASAHSLTFNWTTAVQNAVGLTCVLTFGDDSPEHVIANDCIGAQSVAHTYASFTEPTIAHVKVFSGSVVEWRSVVITSQPGVDHGLADQIVWLRLVNQARSEPRLCGTDWYDSAPPVKLDTRIAKAAQLHSEYMADISQMTHDGPAGLESPGDRITAQGYHWNYYSENVAHGYRTPARAMKAWLHSAGHCRNIMNPIGADFGMGYATDLDGHPYWTQKFGREY